MTPESLFKQYNALESTLVVVIVKWFYFVLLGSRPQYKCTAISLVIYLLRGILVLANIIITILYYLLVF